MLKEPASRKLTYQRKGNLSFKQMFSGGYMNKYINQEKMNAKDY